VWHRDIDVRNFSEAWVLGLEALPIGLIDSADFVRENFPNRPPKPPIAFRCGRVA
jgi:hypothetical protein